MASAKKHSVLFVCLGNICRSTMAELVFLEMIKERGLQDLWHVDSAGTGGWHVGESPHKYELPYFHIDCLLIGNLENSRQVQPSDGKSMLRMLGSFDPKGELVVADPYYGGPGPFDHIFHQITRCCDAFLQYVHDEQRATL